MTIKLMLIFYKLCLIITGVSAINLSLNTYYIRQQLKKESPTFSELQTVDQIVKTPKSKTALKSELHKNGDKGKSKVTVFGNSAYWKINGQIFSSKINERGDVDIENAEKIDVFSLSEIEMKNLFKILDNLDTE